MSYLLYLKKDQEDPTPFKLYEYEEPDGGRLHVPTTLQKLELASLEVQEPGTDLYVPMAFHTQTGLSLDKFKANTQQAPLSVAGKAQVVPAPVLPGGGAGTSQAVAAAQPMAVVATDDSAQLVKGMLEALPPFASLPKNSMEFHAMLNDCTGLSIPFPRNAALTLRDKMPPECYGLLQPVDGYHVAAATFDRLIRQSTSDAGSELSTTICMYNLLHDVFAQLATFSGCERFKFQLNRTEKAAGSTSSATPKCLRPDMLIIFDLCTLLIGGDKLAKQLAAALEDLQTYAVGGLNAQHYGGGICGLPAYAAAGYEVRFCFITRSGKVESVDPLLDLSTVVGRLRCVICAINLYRLMTKMIRALPRLESRKPLWAAFSNGAAEVYLTSTGATKTIQEFKKHARAVDTSAEVLKEAYKAAAEAADAQWQQTQQQPFLVRALEGPDVSARRGYTVRTTPLGYVRAVTTEESARHVALACCKTAAVLHKVGLVHSDFRLPNIVWLSDDHCMVIDLEHARRANRPLPDGLYLSDWEEATFDVKKGVKHYTKSSDMYQIGRLVQQVLPSTRSSQAKDFVRALLSKSLTAEDALQHPWLQE